MSLTACCAVSETSDRDVIKNHEARLADVPEQPANQSSRQALTPVFTLVDWRINLLVGYECSFLRVTFKQGVFQTVRVPDRQTDRWQENERPEGWGVERRATTGMSKRKSGERAREERVC